MTKKISRALFIPAISLLPFTQGLALHEHSHPTVAPSYVTQSEDLSEKANIRAMAVQGKMINSSTIQINTQTLSELRSHNQRRIISLIDKNGIKQRYVLLSPNRSQLIKALIKFHGRLKEFHFYSVIDEKGDDTHLLASKRTVSAPANQLTAVFKKTEDAQSFLAKEQQALTDEDIYQSNKTIEQEQNKEFSKQVSSITNQVEIQLNDQTKSKHVEPVHLFPM